MSKMNAEQEARVPEQMSGQPVRMNPNAGSGQQLQVASSHHGKDAEFINMRRIMLKKIVECLRKKNAARQNLVQIANRLENRLYTSHPTKANYYAMLNEPIERLLEGAIRDLSTQGHQRQQMSQQAPNSSSHSTMVPTPGSISRCYQDPPTNIPQNSTTSSVSSAMCSMGMQRQVTPMIPTPGFSNQQTLQAIPECSNGGGYLNGESNVMPLVQKQQQKPFSINQSSYLQHHGTHVCSGIHSRMPENSSSYGLPDAHVNVGMCTHGSNTQLTNRAAAEAEALMNFPPYGSLPDKALRREFNCHPQQRTPSSLGISVCGNLNGTVSSTLTPASNQNMDAAKVWSNSRTNSGLLTSQTTRQSLQPEPFIKAKLLDQKENLNVRELQLSHERLLQQQHQSMPNHPGSQFEQNLSVLSQANSLKQCNLGSGYDEQLLDQGVSLFSNLMYPKAINDSYKRNHTSEQFIAQNNHIRAISDSQQLLSPHVTNKKNLDDFYQRKTTEDEAQQPVSSNWLIAGCAMTSVNPNLLKLPTRVPEQMTESIKFYRQLRWLLLLIHAKSCADPQGGCMSQDCVRAKELLDHFKNCQRRDCSYRYCRQSKMVIYHYKNCIDEHCPLCSKAKENLRRSSEQTNKCSHKTILVTKKNTIERITDEIYGDRMDIDLVAVETSNDQQSVSKRLKLQPMSPSVSDSAHVTIHQACPGFVLQKAHPKPHGQDTEEPMTINFDTVEKIGVVQSYVITGVSDELDSHVDQENRLSNEDTNADLLDFQKNANGSKDAMLSRIRKTKRKGISLMELFTPEQIYEHILSLRQWVGQSKAKSEKNQAIVHSGNENSCQLCKVERLTFEPQPIYCSPCGARIKRNAPYYTGFINEVRHHFCVPCYSESRSDSIFVDGIQLLKSKLERRKNDYELEEGWVQCDKCQRWQHQICALFNAKRNEIEKDAEYTCHSCYIEEIKHGLRMPLPESTVPGAKDLPRTVLSDHIEERLFRRLKEERHNRAKQIGKTFNEVPGAEGLVVRVVSSVDKKLEVKPYFLDIFQEENYPTEFPYKSKAILLFQRIESVEVCLFGMYVQEFGAECAFPNQRQIYLSYLDSVKYFRPEIETMSGEALRTFVYHEILLGYLEYSKQRGFTSCYIWACPPLKGEDYILYCHPEIQKIPKSDKLREWYLSMLRKATKEGTVVELTNLYDHFFIRKRECKAKVTAARLPYFDGDYWPGAAEDMIKEIRLPENDRNLQKKGKIKKTITKRALKAAGLTDLSGNASKDAMLMQKLGEIIFPMKEDFIMVHLQYSCSHCCILMVSGRRWVCSQCKSFYICDKCYSEEQQREVKERHPSNSTDSHTLDPVEIVGVPEDTKDRDDILESEFFDTRQTFLSLCQGNRYQYDTLRRAKHSSMMVLYHLHNPSAAAFVTTCNVCTNDIQSGQGWRCKECDYDECSICYQKNGGVNHIHKLTKHPVGADRDTQNIRQKRVEEHGYYLKSWRMQEHAVLQFATILTAGKLRHSSIMEASAKYVYREIAPVVRKCGILFGSMPTLVKNPIAMYQDAGVDMKDHFRREQRQSESRRRAVVNEMMRQRAAEVGVNR
ncbi:hypothetical protein ACP70R_043885 [Stipagrostis hirtigluma subsp. patula]